MCETPPPDGLLVPALALRPPGPDNRGHRKPLTVLNIVAISKWLASLAAQELEHLSSPAS